MKQGTRTFTAAIEITVTASGYWDPGVTWRKPEDCYPPEGECNIEEVRIGGTTIPVESLDVDAMMAIERAFFAALEDDNEDE